MFKILSANNNLSDRTFPEDEHPFRSKFERDRDRIMYSKSFRRLSGKTQVFLVGKDEHLRTRLTHTLEVAQISTTISKYFGFDISLSEAIAYGHDLGHTPFGHVGERTLNYIMNGCYPIKGIKPESDKKGFKHNWQSIRVVSEFEQTDREFYGLNLTDYTLYGILWHSSLKYKNCTKKTKDNMCKLQSNGDQECYCDSNESLSFYNRYKLDYLNKWSFEAFVVSMADEIAQRHHDIEDGLITGLMTKEQLVTQFRDVFNKFLSRDERKLLTKIKQEKDSKYYLPLFSRLIVNFLTTNLINSTEKRLKKIIKDFSIVSCDDFEKYKLNIMETYGVKNLINYSDDLQKAEEEFQKYLRNKILNSHLAQSMDGKANFIIRQLFKAYLTNPQQLPDKTIITLYSNLLVRDDFDNLLVQFKLDPVGNFRQKLEDDYIHYEEQNEFVDCLLRTICDYISGMTDKYALDQYKTLYGITD